MSDFQRKDRKKKKSEAVVSAEFLTISFSSFVKSEVSF